MWQHFEGDTFSFYEKLIAGNGIAELQANFEEADLPIKNEMEKIRYYKRFSENERVENLRGIERSLANEKTEESQRLIINNAISKIDFYITKLSESKSVMVQYPFFIDDFQQLKEDINSKFSYLISGNNQRKVSNVNSPKIQWLGKTNVLATLIYDLWQGQDKGSKNPSTKPLIKAQKKDLEQLLVDNFIDAKGNPLTIATISDYLNTSKPEKRAKKSVRIEL